MKPIAIWLHCRLSGAGIDTTAAAAVLLEQIEAMRSSHLLSAADSFTVGVSDMDFALAREIIPDCRLELFEAEKRGELPTLAALKKWLPHYPDCAVFYSHLKCATRSDALCQAWRRCMTHHLIKGWAGCVHQLLSGVESVGCHWMTPEEHPGLVKAPYWGGNFFWANSAFLATLPKLPDHAYDRDTYYLSESWIGLGPRRPRVRDFHHVWPNLHACSSLRREEYP